MRTIIDEPKFLKRLQEDFGISAERLDELREAFIEILARTPEAFPKVPGANLYRVVVNPFPGLVHLNLWFTFDDTSVTFREVDKIE